MQVCLFIDRSRCLRWHLWLAQALSDRGDCTIVLAFGRSTFPLPLVCTLSFEIERLIHGLGRECAADRVSEVELGPWRNTAMGVGKELDLVIDLTGQPQDLPVCNRVLTPLFNSVPTELAALSSLLDGRDVSVEINDSAAAGDPAQARPGLMDPSVLSSSLDNVLSCTVELILKAVGGTPAARTDDYHPPLHAPSPRRPFGIAVPFHLVRVLAWKGERLLRKILRGGDSWAAAWRFDPYSSLLDDGKAGFAILPSDAQRYYADPFPFCGRGHRCIFVEEYKFARGFGGISVATVAADGSVSAPRPVIEEPHHLSYPFVFDHGGEIWMIPESGAANRIDLYRAHRFPYRWKREATLLDGIAAYDSTLFRQDGHFWIFATTGRWKASTWDNLYLFHSEHLVGPWQPCPVNPALLDAAASRPAGALLTRGGAMLRPAQDCSRIYGGAVAVCRIDRLCETGFHQTIVGRVQSDALGCHTYNRHHGLEVIDVFGRVRGAKRITGSYTALSTDQPRKIAA